MKKIEFQPGGTVAGGRITRYVAPVRGMHYALGYDSAYGIEGKDKDALELFDTNGQQVLEAEGSWGEHADGPIEMISKLYGQVFIVGERSACGLIVLRRLYDRGFWCYFEREEAARGRPIRDRLGHVPGKNDITVRLLQRAIGPRDNQGELLPPRVKIHSSELHDQLCKYGYRPRASNKTFDEAKDADLVMGAPAGEHDDLVRAAALAVAGIEWLPHFEAPKPTFAPDSYGAIMGLNPAKKKPDSYF